MTIKDESVGEMSAFQQSYLNFTSGKQQKSQGSLLKRNSLKHLISSIESG